MMVSKQGGKQTSYVVGRSSSSSGVSTQSLPSTVFEIIQQNVPASPDEVQSPSLRLNSPNTYPTVVMVSKRGGKQTSYVVGRSSSSSGVSTQSLPSTNSEIIQQNVPASPDEVQSPSLRLNSTNTDPTVGTSKNVRRNSRSLGLDNMRGTNKIQIEICKFTGNPVGLHSENFSSEVGIITRLFAAPDALQWRHVSAENKATLFKFLRDRYKSNQYKFRQQFKKHPTKELALANVPKKISKVAWRNKCEAWSDPSYMEKCKINKKNRSKLFVPHTSGSKSFRKVQHEQRNPETGEEATLVRLYEATHYSSKRKAWVNDKAESIYGKLKARDDEAMEDGTGPLTAEELSIDVLGYKSVSIKGLGREAKPSTSSSEKKCRVQLERELETTRKELEEQRSANQQLVDRVQSFESNSMQINSKLDLLIEQLTRAQPSYNSSS